MVAIMANAYKIKKVHRNFFFFFTKVDVVVIKKNDINSEFR